MNNQGRHYRDQDDVTNPMCDYVSSNGVSCDFFSSSHEHSNIPYPTDVSFGPVAAGPGNDVGETPSHEQNNDLPTTLSYSYKYQILLYPVLS